jgi:ABC-type transporter Mla MlaB component
VSALVPDEVVGVIGTEKEPVRTLGFWAAPGGSAVVDVRLVHGVMVVRLQGCLDAGVLQPVRAALDVATVAVCAVVVVDLAQVAPPVPAAVALLGGLRRYLLARGSTMTLAAVPRPLMVLLRQAGVRDLYEITETVADGVARAVGGAPH